MATLTTPEEATTWANVLVGLFGSVVEESSIDEHGQLVLVFSNRLELLVNPSDEVEAYDLTFASTSPRRILCLAGGALDIQE